jgi:hypothetical protein
MSSSPIERKAALREEIRSRVIKARQALDFAREMITLGVPEKTALVSLKAEHGLNTAEAREYYRKARQAKPRRRHGKKA